MDETLQIDGDVPLAPLTTLGVGGRAELFCRVRSEAALSDAIQFAQLHELPLTLLGSGSNVIVPDAGVRGLVIQLALRGVSLHDVTPRKDARSDGDTVELRVAAGEPWDEVVARACDEGLAGLEALSGIPGSTGATPVQNVGAYGQEVADTIVGVRTVSLRTGEPREWQPRECAFAYRDSVFKRALERVSSDEAHAVVEVRFALRRGLAAPARYAELQRALGGDSALPVARVREAVLALRRAKSMVYERDASARDENARSVGSFFTNPLVDAERAAHVVEVALREALVARAEDVPRWVEPDGRVKLAAGWLVEKSGFARGTRRGPVGLSTRHALALVCHEGATASALMQLAEEVRSAVFARFGVTLAREPVWLGD